MSENPFYNMFRHAFLILGNANEGETLGLFDGAPVDEYANTIVNDLFVLNIQNIETEAALIMNVWMVIVYELFQVLDACSAQATDKGNIALDRAIALWIGADQPDGSNEHGYMLYNLAEIAGEFFGQDNGESQVNSEVVDILNTLQANLAGSTCSNSGGVLVLREQVKRLVAVMTIPLVQLLVHHIMNVGNDGGSNFVELYALSVIPRVAACDPHAYQNELHDMVLRELTVNDQQPAIAAIQKAYSCFQITCKDVGSYKGGEVPQCQDPTSVTLAGYTSNRQDMITKTYLDRDILQIDINLKFRAFATALDLFNNGWNSVYTLQQMAKGQVIPSSTNSLFSQFATYYQSSTFANEMFVNIVKQVSPYNGASTDQTRNLATGILTYVIMYAGMVSSLQYAVEQCQSGKSSSALEYWDSGVAFFVGSMEGDAASGTAEGGELLFTTAKQLCVNFGTCASVTDGTGASQNAVSNEVIMTGLIDGLASLSNGTCQFASNILNTQIIPNAAIPVIQGTVQYASFDAGLLPGTSDASLAIGYAFSRGVLPLVNQSLPASATTISKEMEFQLTSQSVPDGFPSVADALRLALPSMATNCKDIGVYQDEGSEGNLCPDGGGSNPTASPAPVAAPAPVNTNPADIAWGRYVFSSVTIADGDGNFALDVRDMFNAPSNNYARNVYLNGANALTPGLSGVTGITSLSKMSTDASQYMSHDAMFNIFKFALYNDADLEDTSGQDFVYANDIILEALANGRDHKLAAEGSVILNVWMVIANRLYSAVRECSSGQPADIYIDSAVALWIGKEQVEGKFDSGWMLYSIGQSAAKFFGAPEGEAPVNTELMQLFNDAQAIAKTCTGTANAWIGLRVKAMEIIRKLSKPLIQTLLFHLVKSDKNMVELYAVASVPQCAACNPTANNVLESVLYSGYQHSTSLTDEVMGYLASFFRCLRIQCSDLPVYPTTESGLQDLITQICDKLQYDGQYPIVGYVPSTNVSEVARLDLDVLEIQVLMLTKAYRAALDTYQQGHHAYASSDGQQLISLQSLATSSDRSSVPQYKLFSQAYGSPNYADEMVMYGLNQNGAYKSASRRQLAEEVFRSLQSMVTLMSVLTKMQLAVDNCNANSTNAALSDWDTAVALFVGSIEGFAAGSQPAGTGRMMYALGNEICPYFDVCETNGESTENQDIMSKFAGLNVALQQSQCDYVEREINETIIPSMEIPLVQGTLYYAITNVGLDPTVGNDTIVSGDILAAAVQPLVNEANSTSAGIISRNFNFQNVQIPDGTSSVFEAFTYAVRGMGINCELVGTPVDAPSLSVCTSQNVAPLPDTPTNLGDNLYVTTTYVQDKANIALDVKDMISALNEGNTELAKLIYKNGKNSEVYDENGRFVSLRSLQSFSTDATLQMSNEPVFNVFQYALQGGGSTTNSARYLANSDMRLYADNIVEAAFSSTNSKSKTVPAEAAVALNLWMYLVHQLYATLQGCEDRSIKDEDGIHSIDIAVAYYIGDGQVAGNSQTGHLLYALAEKMGEYFGMGGTGQTRTNTNILRLFSEAKNELSLPNACSASGTTFNKLSLTINKIISQMTIPLIQGLIQNLRVNDRDRVKVYGTAFVPMVAACNATAFSYLRDKVMNLNYNVVEIDAIIETVRSTYPCLRLQCDDIGVYVSDVTDTAPPCQDPDLLTPLAGYKPSTDVREVGVQNWLVFTNLLGLDSFFPRDCSMQDWTWTFSRLTF